MIPVNNRAVAKFSGIPTDEITMELIPENVGDIPTASNLEIKACVKPQGNEIEICIPNLNAFCLLSQR